MDSTTFKRLILPLQPAMQLMAQSVLGDASLAEDAVQDAVVELWQQRESLSQVRNLEAFCITLVKRRSVDILRRQHPYSPIDEQALMAEDPPPNDLDERYQQAMALLAQLPERQRQVITLKYEHNKDNKEIEKTLHMSSTHLYATLSRAYANLRELLQTKQ